MVVVFKFSGNQRMVNWIGLLYTSYLPHDYHKHLAHDYKTSVQYQKITIHQLLQHYHMSVTT